MGARGYGTPTSHASQQELRQLGVTALSITPFAYMATVDSNAIQLMTDRPGSETDEVVRQEVRWAKELGMQTMLKPHIWIRGGAYRGRIEHPTPEARVRWWQSYRRFVLHYALLAESMEVELFCIGVELDQTVVPFESEWRELIQDVRRVFPGRLVYAANWDKVDAPRFWSALDYIGVQFYPPLAGSRHPSEQLLERQLQMLSELSGRVDRPVLLTEVGFRSTSDALSVPHRWPETEKDQADEAAQANAYALLFGGLTRFPRVEGAFVWKWFTDPATREEGEVGFSPRAKQAQSVLRRAYRGDE